MPLRNSPDTYGSLAKFLHWSVVILIISQYFLAEAADELPDGVEKLSILTTHKSFGMLVLMLAVIRIGWRIVNGRNPAPVPMPGWQTTAAAAGHGLLYLLLLAQPISGWMMSSAANFPVTFFGLFQFPAIASPDEDAHETYEEVHEFIFELLLVVAVLHALAALYHHFFLKDNSLRRMLPFGGRKG